MTSDQSDDPITFKFGDSETLCNRLLDLVRSGRKTATCEAQRAFEPGHEVMPVVGRRDVALNRDGTRALLLETTSIVLARFCDIDEAFALAEGENDDLEGWRRNHQAYFERTVGFEPEMMVVCERFRLVRDLNGNGK